MGNNSESKVTQLGERGSSTKPQPKPPPTPSGGVLIDTTLFDQGPI